MKLFAFCCFIEVERDETKRKGELETQERLGLLGNNEISKSIAKLWCGQ